MNLFPYTLKYNNTGYFFLVGGLWLDQHMCKSTGWVVLFLLYTAVVTHQYVKNFIILHSWCVVHELISAFVSFSDFQSKNGWQDISSQKKSNNYKINCECNLYNSVYL